MRKKTLFHWKKTLFHWKKTPVHSCSLCLHSWHHLLQMRCATAPQLRPPHCGTLRVQTLTLAAGVDRSTPHGELFHFATRGRDFFAIAKGCFFGPPDGSGLETLLHLFHRHIPKFQHLRFRQGVAGLPRMDPSLVEDFAAVDVAHACQHGLIHQDGADGFGTATGLDQGIGFRVFTEWICSQLGGEAVVQSAGT